MSENNSLNWKHVFNSIKDSIVLLDTNGFIKDCNEAFKKLVNKSRTQIIGYECSKVIFGRTDKLKNCPFLRSKRLKKRESLTVDKDDRQYNVDVDPIFDKNHQISGFVLFISDITEHRKAEKVLEESEEKFRTLTENINVGIYRNTVGQKGKFIEANPAIVKMFGFKNKEDFLAYNVSELYLQPEERKKYNDEMLEKGFVKDKVLQLMQKDGTPFIGSISAVTIKDNKGNLQFYDGIIEDITKRKKAENALWENEKKYKDLFEKSKDAILIINNDKFVDCNQATIDMLQYKDKGEFLNTHPSELSPEKQPDGKMSLPKANEMMKIAFENGSHRFEWNHKKYDGEIFPVEVLLTSISSDEKNQILHTVWRDITERKKAEIALQKEKEYYRTFVTALNDWVWEMDLKGFHTYSNPAVESVLGYKVAEVVGHHVTELWVESDEKNNYSKILEKALSNGKGWKHNVGKFQHKNGSIITTESSANPIYNSDKKIIGYRGVDHDITERIKAELALQESELRFRSIFSNISNIAVQGYDKDRKVTFWNKASEKLYGYSQKEVINKQLEDLIIPTEMRADIISMIYNWHKKNIQIPNGEMILIKKDNSPVHVFSSHVMIEKSNGEKEMFCIDIDITERKRAEEELRSGRERLKMLNKIIRHDLSNDFIVIKSAINIFRRTTNAIMINEIEGRVDKSLRTIEKYRKYESVIDSNKDLDELEIAELLNELIAEFPKIKFKIEGECKVLADDALNSIFTNLITNSIKHGKASEIDVKISTENNMCEIEFMDNGTGIPDKIKDKIFDEGFSHGKAGHTGIGLHIVRKTIESYGGSISVEDNLPRGTTFIILLRQAQ